MRQGSQLYPSSEVLLSGLLTHASCAILLTEQTFYRLNCKGGVIMTRLRALVGACFLLAVIGTVVAVPIGWAFVLGIGEAFPEKLTAASLTYLR
jgi:hypothetical protein